MKTKLLLLAALAALTVYSCTSERQDEEIQTLPKEKMQKLNKNITSKTESDSIVAPLQNAYNGGIKLDPTDDAEIIPPGDVKPPKGK